MALTILGISGSLRKASFNSALLRAAIEFSPPGVTIEPLYLHGIPPFNQDEENAPVAPVVELKSRIRAAGAVLFCAPEYNYSIPGVLKNAIDCASRPYNDNAWDGKPVAVMGASPGPLGTARCQYHLRQVFLNLGVVAVTRPEVMLGSATQRFDENLVLTDQKSREMVTRLIEALAALAGSVPKA